ncbi:17599_t:CDS:2, partial [Racocetra persica]
SKTFHGWYIYPLPYEMSIKEFFDKLIIEEISPEYNINIDPFEIIESIELSQSVNTTTIQAGFDCEIIKVTKIFGVNIYYHLKSNNSTTSHSISSSNTLEILMQNLRKKQIYLPKFFGRANPKSYKVTQKPFDADELSLHCQTLALFTTSL